MLIGRSSGTGAVQNSLRSEYGCQFVAFNVNRTVPCDEEFPGPRGPIVSEWSLDWLGPAARKVSNVPGRKRRRKHTVAKALNKCEILAGLAFVFETRFTMRPKASRLEMLSTGLARYSCFFTGHLDEDRI